MVPSAIPFLIDYRGLRQQPISTDLWRDIRGSPQYLEWQEKSQTFTSLMRLLKTWMPSEYSYCGKGGRKWVRQICEDAGTSTCDCLIAGLSWCEDMVDNDGVLRERGRIQTRHVTVANTHKTIQSLFEDVITQQSSGLPLEASLASLRTEVESLQKFASESVRREEGLFNAYDKFARSACLCTQNWHDARRHRAATKNCLVHHIPNN